MDVQNSEPQNMENQPQNDDEVLLNPMDINEPIEGILISEEEKRIAPILQITIMEGMKEMIG